MTRLAFLLAAALGVTALASTVLPVAWLAWVAFPTRRRLVAGAASALLLALGGSALVNGGRPPLIREITVPLASLPPAASGFTLVQLSDLHLGRLTPQGGACAIAATINAMNADLVVVTGDLIDADAGRDTEFGECLRTLSARYGVVAVPGNHDYAAGIERFQQVAGRAGITILLNERLPVGDAIQVAGLDEAAGRSVAQGGPDLDKALAGRRPDRPIVLLSHAPFGFDRAARRGIDLQLSGHLHAGQIPPMDLLVWLTVPCSYGWCEKAGSGLYVTSGTGTWGPPMRLFSRNEIVRFTLVPRR